MDNHSNHNMGSMGESNMDSKEDCIFQNKGMGNSLTRLYTIPINQY